MLKLGGSLATGTKNTFGFLFNKIIKNERFRFPRYIEDSKPLQKYDEDLSAAKELLTSMLGNGDIITAPASTISESPEGKVIEGVFDGQIMIGPDGKNYPVPANYASKSKLVEGDILKLTIGESGKFMYKQIGPVERKTVIGTLTSHDDQYFVEINGKEYKILYASVTYFRLKVGDQVTVVIPADNDDATWAAVEASL